MHWDLAQDLCPFSFYCKILTKVTYSSKRLPSLIALHAFHRESEGTAIKIPELMQLNKGAARKFELGGGFATDPRCFQSLFFFFIMTSCIHTMQTIFWMIFKNNIRGNFSQSLVQRWLDETWPLGVQCAMTQGRKGAFDLNFHARSICTFPSLISFALTTKW